MSNGLRISGFTSDRISSAEYLGSNGGDSWRVDNAAAGSSSVRTQSRALRIASNLGGGMLAEERSDSKG